MSSPVARETVQALRAGAVMGADRPMTPEEVRVMEDKIAMLSDALARIVTRADGAIQDLGGGELVDGDVARGSLTVQRGIAREALARMEAA